MKQYLDLCRTIMTTGRDKVDRTGTGTRGIFGYQMRFNLADGFPLLTTKKLHLKSIIHELLWFMQGSSNIRYLTDNGVHIWDEWAKDDSIDFVMSHVKFLDHLKSSRPELVDLYTEWASKNDTTILNRSVGPAICKIRHWAIANEVACTYKRPILNLDDRLNWYLGHIDPEILDSVTDYVSRNIQWMWDKNIENGVSDSELAEYLDSKGVPQISVTHGELGPVYGVQWRKWQDVRVIPDSKVGEFHDRGGFEHITELWEDGKVTGHVVAREIDQIKNMIDTLKKNPMSRRIIVTAWNPSVVDEQALPPCHALFQFYTEEATVEERLKAWLEEGYDPPGEMDTMELHSFFDEGEIPKYRLSCQLYQRSCDTFLGVPFNIASYSLLTMMVAQCVDMIPGDFVWTGGDTHIYKNHFEQIELQLTREPRALPKMLINPNVKEIDGFKFEDFELVGYDPHPHIAGKVSV